MNFFFFKLSWNERNKELLRLNFNFWQVYFIESNCMITEYMIMAVPVKNLCVQK